MDLYFSPMAGSFPVHVSCLEIGVDPTLHHVDRRTKQLGDGGDYRAVAPQGIVPVIGLPDGGVLTESAAVLQYIADRAPERGLAPPWGTLARYRLVEWLNFTSTEIHKKLLAPVFGLRSTDEVKAWARGNAGASLDHVARHLASREYLVGDGFTVADAYLWWALFVAPFGGISLDGHPVLKAYVERIRARPSVAAALAYEAPLYQRAAADLPARPTTA